MKTKSMMWAAAPLLLAITATTAKAAELTTLASASPALEADAYGAVSESVLWGFPGSPDDGFAPSASLIEDQWGNLYGTTEVGGASSLCLQGCGTVFELSPPLGKSLLWSERVLYSFGATSDDGTIPDAALIADKSGNLYGMTSAGGANSCPNTILPGCGTVFELSPPVGKSTQWTERVLWSFGATSDDGQTPGFQAALLADKSGNLYGTTLDGGADGDGTVFELSPPYGKSSQWSERVLYSFAGGPDDGESPVASLIADKSGNLYGTTFFGGADGDGTVFELSPPYGKSSTWNERVLWNFGSPDDGAAPASGLLADKAGNLYGTTGGGGASSNCAGGCGTVFELRLPDGKSTQWSERVLWSFSGSPGDGDAPQASLIADQQGNLYGTTNVGGTIGNGTVFELSPPYGKSTQWSERLLHSFGTVSDDGAVPFAGLLADQWGNLYGTTFAEGPNGGGTVYKVTNP